MGLADISAWFRLGRPKKGTILSHPRGSFSPQEAFELPARLNRAFGDLPALSALDLGAGTCDSFLGAQVLEIPWKRLVSVEAFIPNIHRLKAKPIKAADHEVVEGRIENAAEDVKFENFDVALLLNVVMELERREVLKLLCQLERRLKQGIVIYSPLGRLSQESPDPNALERQRSFWKANDFARLGYDVEIFEGADGDSSSEAAWAIKRLNREDFER